MDYRDAEMWEFLGGLAGVLVGAVAASIGTYFGQSSLAARSLRSDWADKSASTLADVQKFLTDAHPDLLIRNDRPFSSEFVYPADQERFSAALEAAQDTERVGKLRRDVAVLAAGHPDPQVREDAATLESEIASLWFVSNQVSEMLERGASDETRDHADHITQHAQTIWSNTNKARQQLIDHLHT